MDKIRKSDVVIAKKYLHEGDIDELIRIVVMCLDYAVQVIRHQKILLSDWDKRLDEYIQFHEQNTLQGSDSMSPDEAVKHAEKEYESFSKIRRLEIEEETEVKYLEELKSSVKMVVAKRIQK